MKAHAAARNKGLLDRIAFRLADMNDLPFRDDAFDGAITQATIMFSEKRKALQMLLRKVCPQSFVGPSNWHGNPLRPVK